MKKLKTQARITKVYKFPVKIEYAVDRKIDEVSGN